jgi:hypothetical protein
LPAGEVMGWLDHEAVETLAQMAKTVKRLRRAATFW